MFFLFIPYYQRYLLFTICSNATILDTRNSTEANAPGIVISTGADTAFPSIGISVSDGTNTGAQFTDSACSSVLLDGLFHRIFYSFFICMHLY